MTVRESCKVIFVMNTRGGGRTWREQWVEAGPRELPFESPVYEWLGLPG
jgi:hypothetical protein